MDERASRFFVPSASAPNNEPRRMMAKKEHPQKRTRGVALGQQRPRYQSSHVSRHERVLHQIEREFGEAIELEDVVLGLQASRNNHSRVSMQRIFVEFMSAAVGVGVFNAAAVDESHDDEMVCSREGRRELVMMGGGRGIMKRGRQRTDEACLFKAWPVRIFYRRSRPGGGHASSPRARGQTIDIEELRRRGADKTGVFRIRYRHPYP